MEELLSVLGKDLYEKVLDKLGNRKLIIDDGRLIPKHRFDCINVSLKDHKSQLVELRKEVFAMTEKLAVLQSAQENAKELERTVAVLTELSKHKAKNFQTIMPLLNLEDLSGAQLQDSLVRQIRRLKRKEPYLFSGGEELYRIVPYRGKNKTEA